MNFSLFGGEAKSTGFNAKLLREMAKQSIMLPDGFKVHHRLQKHFIESRLKAIETD